MTRAFCVITNTSEFVHFCRYILDNFHIRFENCFGWNANANMPIKLVLYRMLCHAPFLFHKPTWFIARVADWIGWDTSKMVMVSADKVMGLIISDYWVQLCVGMGRALVMANGNTYVEDRVSGSKLYPSSLFSIFMICHA